jgi:hypothetical protein
VEALIRSVGRTNGHRGGLGKLFRRKGALPTEGSPNGRPREDFAFDFRDPGDDVWRTFRKG